MLETIKTLLALALVAALLGCGGLWVVGGGDAYFEHEGIHRIAKPADEVFKWMTKPDLRRQWVSDLVGTKKNTPGGLDTGTKFTEEFDFGDGRTSQRVQVTGFEPDSLYAVKTTTEDYVLEVTYKFGALHTGKKTRVDFRIEVQFEGGWSKLFEPILAHRLRSRIEDDLEALREVVELQRY